MGADLTGSKLQLAMYCGYSFREDVEIPDEPENEAQASGNRMHAAAAQFIGPDRPDPKAWEALTDDESERMNVWARHWSSEIAPDLDLGIQTEIAYSYSPTTEHAKRLGWVEGRDYAAHGVTRDEIPMTLDVVGESFGELVVIDHKTGRNPVASAATNMQLRAGALAASICHGKDSATIAIHYIQQDGTIREDKATLDLFDLSDVRDELRAIMRRVRDPETPPVPGSHCHELYCPAISVCPAQRQALAEVVPVDLSAQIVSPEQLLKSYETRKIATKLLKSLEKAERDYVDASGGSVQLPDGRQFKRVMRRGSRRVNAKAVREAHGDEFDTTGPDYPVYQPYGKATHQLPAGADSQPESKSE